MLEQEKLKELLNYNSQTGQFTWKVTLANGIQAGTVAGSLNPNGYWHIRYNGRAYRNHRLAWLYVYGKFPVGIIDHINRDKSDNRIGNLRECSRSDNTNNCDKRVSNKSGFKGVSLDKNTGKYKAQITVNGKLKYLGLFSTPEEASMVYNSHAKEHHGKFYNDTRV